MTHSMPKSAVHALAAIVGALGLIGAGGVTAAAEGPLPASSYGVRAACAEPAPGEAGCLALQLVPETAQARARATPLAIAGNGPLPARSAAAGDYGLRPQDIHSAYQLPTSVEPQQTIALVDAYNDPTAEADLKAYDEEFALPACTAANGCFKQVNQNGETGKPPFPATSAILEHAREAAPETVEAEEAEEATGWGLEISLDIEAAHATCQTCRILLVEASSPSFSNLNTAEASAAALGATEISNSWGGPERGLSASFESASAFNRPGIVITASAGDDGYLSWDAAGSLQRGYAEFPASSPHVVAVGGTRLSLNAGGSWAGETVWNGDGAGGGGCSTIFEVQPWQRSVAGWAAVGCASKRAVADVAADADPYSGLAVRDTSPECETRWEEAKVKHVDHWCTIGGTSLASPLIAAVFALAGGADGASYPARTLYLSSDASQGALHDVAAGSNGACSTPFQTPSLLSSCSAGEEAQSCTSRRICLAASGYDGPTGVGTPSGISAFEPGSGTEPQPEPLEGGGTLHTPSGSSTGSPPASSAGSGSEAGTPAPRPRAGRTDAGGPARISAVALTLRALIALESHTSADRPAGVHVHEQRAHAGARHAGETAHGPRALELVQRDRRRHADRRRRSQLRPPWRPRGASPGPLPPAAHAAARQRALDGLPARLGCPPVGRRARRSENARPRAPRRCG